MLPTVPHYVCYQIIGDDPPAIVDLTTQFPTEFNVAVGQATRLCAPALKTLGGVTEGSLTVPHLKCYIITGPAPSPTFVVNLETQFPLETGVEVGIPDRLCVPALKEVTFPTPTGDCPNPASVPWVEPPGDLDCDGWSSSDESFGVPNIGTIHNDACPATGAVSHPGDPTKVNDEDPDAWPADMNDNQVVNLADILFLAPPVFFSIGPLPPYQLRFDMNLDNVINLSDILFLAPPVFFSTCTP